MEKRIPKKTIAVYWLGSVIIATFSFLLSPLDRFLGGKTALVIKLQSRALLSPSFLPEV